jgi:hypothetical protein
MSTKRNPHMSLPYWRLNDCRDCQNYVSLHHFGFHRRKKYFFCRSHPEEGLSPLAVSNSPALADEAAVNASSKLLPASQ